MEAGSIPLSHPQSRIAKLPRNHPNFPEEIIAGILARLPVNSLLRFRCVSKSWRSLISNAHFIQSHLTAAQNDPQFRRHAVVSSLLLPTCALFRSSLRSLLVPDSDFEAAADDLDYPMKTPNNAVRIVGCCNGLVSIAISGQHFFLWNPTIRQSRKLPDPDDLLSRGLFITKYGFGFDVSGQDYKVVAILSGFTHSGRYETVVKSYSLRTNSWKRIPAFNDGLPYDDVAKFVNGNLHWGRRFGLDATWEIVALDLGSETTRVIAQPHYIDSGFIPSLGILRGCLCVVCDFPQVSADVWIMKEYGLGSSWEKIVTVPYDAGPWKGPYSGPLWMAAGSGELLMVYGSTFVVYDPRGFQFRYPRLMTFLEADVYVESLVPLE